MTIHLVDRFSRCGPGLVSAMAILLCSTVYAADTESPAHSAEVSDAKAADNTARNADDRDMDNLTPLDQSHDAKDVDITRAIRKALMDDDRLGTNAKNVKVITLDGSVTLRGVVASAGEKARVLAIANEAGGLQRVQDELEVIAR